MEELIKRHDKINEEYIKSTIDFDEWEMKIILDKTINDEDKFNMIKTKRNSLYIEMVDNLTKLKDDFINLKYDLIDKINSKTN